MSKEVTSERVANVYNKKNNSEKIKILYDAIDIMSMWNGRSRFNCIAIAMGYKESDELYIEPELKEAKNDN